MNGPDGMCHKSDGTNVPTVGVSGPGGTASGDSGASKPAHAYSIDVTLDHGTTFYDDGRHKSIVGIPFTGNIWVSWQPRLIGISQTTSETSSLTKTKPSTQTRSWPTWRPSAGILTGLVGKHFSRQFFSLSGPLRKLFGGQAAVG